MAPANDAKAKGPQSSSDRPNITNSPITSYADTSKESGLLSADPHSDKRVVENHPTKDSNPGSDSTDETESESGTGTVACSAASRDDNSNTPNDLQSQSFHHSDNPGVEENHPAQDSNPGSDHTDGTGTETGIVAGSPASGHGNGNTVEDPLPQSSKEDRGEEEFADEGEGEGEGHDSRSSPINAVENESLVTLSNRDQETDEARDDAGDALRDDDEDEDVDDTENNDEKEHDHNSLTAHGDDDNEDDNGADSDSSSSDDVSVFLARLDAEIDSPPDADDQKSDDTDNPAIDKGYAWVICIAVFFIQFLYVGYLKCGGILFVEFQKRFGASSSMISSIIGLEEAACSIGSFVCLGFVLKKISPRTLSLIGCVFFIMGVAGCALADGVELLFLTHGIFFGFAIASNYGTSLVVLTQYFIKRRPLAMSISTTGTSVGGIVLPLLTRYFFSEYDYAGGILLTAGTVMHVFIAVTLMLPVESHRRRLGPGTDLTISVTDAEKAVGSEAKPTKFSQYLRRKLNIGDEGRNADGLDGSRLATSATLLQQQNRSCHNSNASVHRVITPSQTFDQNKMFPSGKGGLNFDFKLEICEEGVPLKIDTSAYDQPSTPTNSQFFSFANRIPIGVDAVNESPFGSHSSQINGSVPSIHRLHPDNTSRSRHFVTSMRSGLDTDSNFTADGNQNSLNPNNNNNANSNRNLFSSMMRLSSLSTSVMFHSTTTLNTVADMVATDVNLLPFISDKNHHEQEDGRSCSKKPSFRGIGRSCSENPLLRSLTFWLLVVFFFCGCIGHALPQMYVPSLARERGLSEDDGAFFVSMLNLLDIPSHLIPGILVTMRVAPATRICVLPGFILCVVCYLTFLYDSYEKLLIMCIVLGLCGGFYFSMQTMIIIEVLGVSHFASTIGFYYLVMGFGAALSYPIAGAIRDTTGSYTASYIYLASVQLVSTTTLVFLPLSRKYDIRRGVLKDESDC